ncbi:PspA/IM30 family protein [Spirulina sp. CCNP1310]|uniref:PspA/IM30 family protein n=1 Tax=Spirulina sp. CCNP1310 TaxID=3110249 RepID=UPI002B203F7E|nr:PspA/IM30 family protein [Spirulina sp. CCNP1310]MEA5419960.1 PspA/IM30 family protein [Spirulina sp. CCNP1310]
MTVWKRAWRLVEANVNHWITATEDPAQRLMQMITQMQEELTTLRQGVAMAIATHKRTERQALQNEAAAADCYQRAQGAIAAQDEPTARAALHRRHTYQETAAFLRSQLQEQGGAIAKLKQDLQTLESRYAQAWIKQEMIMARLQSAQASRRLQELLSATEDSPWAMFDRVEAQLLTEEAVVELADNTSEAKFNRLEREARLEAELNQLKMQGGAS